jgi:hypothetical protein
VVELKRARQVLITIVPLRGDYFKCMGVKINTDLLVHRSYGVPIHLPVAFKRNRTSPSPSDRIIE